VEEFCKSKKVGALSLRTTPSATSCVCSASASALELASSAPSAAFASEDALCADSSCWCSAVASLLPRVDASYSARMCIPTE
jgi:hypothetical protein